MPEGVDYKIIYDPTQFVRASIESVVHTLLEAVLLVVLVVILFLQTCRITSYNVCYTKLLRKVFDHCSAPCAFQQ